MLQRPPDAPPESHSDDTARGEDLDSASSCEIAVSKAKKVCCPAASFWHPVCLYPARTRLWTIYVIQLGCSRDKKQLQRTKSASTRPNRNPSQTCDYSRDP